MQRHSDHRYEGLTQILSQNCQVQLGQVTAAYIFSQLNFESKIPVVRRLEKDVLLLEKASFHLYFPHKGIYQSRCGAIHPKFPSCTDFQRSKSFSNITVCSCFMLLRCSSRTEFFMRSFNLERSVSPVKRCRWNSFTVCLCVVIFKLFGFCRCVFLSVFVSLSRRACPCSVLNVYPCSWLLSRLPKFILQTGLAFLTPVFPWAFRTKSWHSAAGLQAALCVCVCVFVTESLAFVCLCTSDCPGRCLRMQRSKRGGRQVFKLLTWGQGERFKIQACS